MLIIVTGDNKSFRVPHVIESLALLPQSDVLVVDDAEGDISSLEQYLYPSLFVVDAPVVHARFMTGVYAEQWTPERTKQFAASPTLFLFEEFSLASPMLATLKKHGAIVHTEGKTVSQKKASTIFTVTNALTAPDKKARWIALHQSLEEHPIEALLGILYWKLNDSIKKGGRDVERFRTIYIALINAHASAWETGAPLALAVEKVILTH